MIYVDRVQRTKYNPKTAVNFYSFCHLTADNLDELIEFAEKIGLKREWLQESRNGTPHFDLTLNKRKLALKLGAIERTNGKTRH
jgi:hypothetical protein